MKTKFALILILFLLLVNAAAGSEIEGETPTIIKIVVIYDGAVVEDAKVELSKNNTILYSKNTNEYGGVLFVLEINEQEMFEVEVSKEGFDKKTENITIIPYQENSFEIKLRKPQEEPETNGGPSHPSQGPSGIPIPPIAIETWNETKTLNISKINITNIPENITPEEILELFNKKNITLDDFGADIGEVIAGEEFSIITLPDAKVLYCNQTLYADENGRVSFIAVEGQNLLIITKGNYTAIVPINAKKITIEELVEDKDEDQKDDTLSPVMILIAIIILILIVIFIFFIKEKKRRIRREKMNKILLVISIVLIVILILTPIQNSQVPEPTTIEVIVKTINGDPIENAVVELIDNETILFKDETNEYGGVLFISSNLIKTNLLLHIQHILSVYKPIIVNISEDNYYEIILDEPCDLNNDGIIVHDYKDLINAYKCFLGIETDCNAIGFQEWNNMKSEYICFMNTK